MVFINFHGLLLLEDLLAWAPGEIILTPAVKKEAFKSKAGYIPWTEYIDAGRVIYYPMISTREQKLFADYINREISGTVIHEGEASVLAVAIIGRYGLASDERVVREEYQRVTGKPGLHSWDIVELAVGKGFLSGEKVKWIKKGLHYV